MQERRRKEQKRESGSNKDKDASNGSKYQGPKKGRTTFKELKRRIAELESKEAAEIKMEIEMEMEMVKMEMQAMAMVIAATLPYNENEASHSHS